MTKVTARLGRLVVREDYIIVCKSITRGVIDGPDETGKVQIGLILGAPIEYTREDLLKKYDSKAIVSRWAYTYTDDGKPAMAVVIE